MEPFAHGIRERARELGLSDAEVARRTGLSERRYGYYATGEREPNLATLLRICTVLAVTPNDMLLPSGKSPAQSHRARSIARIAAAANNLSVVDLEVAAYQLARLLAQRLKPAARKRRRKTA